MMAHDWNSSTGEVGQVDQKFKVILSHLKAFLCQIYPVSAV